MIFQKKIEKALEEKTIDCYIILYLIKYFIL